MQHATLQRIKRPLRRWLRPAQPLIQFAIHHQPNPIHAWRRDPAFWPLWKRVERYTLVEPAACYVLFNAARHVRGLQGAVAEFGVYRGGTALLLSEVLPDRPLFLFDTFSGMLETDPELDVHRPGDFADTTSAAVEQLLGHHNDVRIRAGLFPDTAAGLDTERFSLVHIDADLYSSVRDGCRFFFERLVPGGVAIFDDYGAVTTPGARRAVDEYFSARDEQPIYLPTGQAIVWKLGD
jgi:hypothetical protein